MCLRRWNIAATADRRDGCHATALALIASIFENSRVTYLIEQPKLPSYLRRACPLPLRRSGEKAESVRPVACSDGCAQRRIIPFKVLEPYPTSCAQAVPCLFDSAQEARVVLEAVFEPVLFQLEAD